MEEKEFYDKLYLQYAKLMFSYALKYTENSEDAEGVVQAAIEKLLGRYSTLVSLTDNALAAYIIYTVRSIGINTRKKEAKTEPISEYSDTLCSPSPEEAVLSRIHFEQITKNWCLLSEKDRILLAQKYLLDYSIEELAKYYNCSSASIRVKLHRAREKAKEILLKDVNN